MKIKWPKQITLSDVILLVGFAALCYGCWQLAPWCGWAVGGAVLMFYASARASAIAWLKIKRNRGNDAS